MRCYCIIFVSTATIEFGEDELLHLLSQARELNGRYHITGMLAYSEGKFLQVLEGEQAAVETVYADIAADLRHGKLEKLADGWVEQNRFAHWNMGFIAPVGCHAQLPNFTPLGQLPAIGPLRQLLLEFLAASRLPIR